jgi:hypothetical protein
VKIQIPNLAMRFRAWLLAPVFAYWKGQAEHVTNFLVGSRQEACRANKLVEGLVDNLSRIRPSVVNPAHVSHGEMVEMINSGKAMVQHQLKNREEEIRILQTEVARLAREYSDEYRKNAELTSKLGDAKVSLIAAKKALEHEKLRYEEAKSAADVGSTKPRRKSSQPRPRTLRSKERAKNL